MYKLFKNCASSFIIIIQIDHVDNELYIKCDETSMKQKLYVYKLILLITLYKMKNAKAYILYLTC